MEVREKEHAPRTLQDDPAGSPEVAIIVLNWNGWRDTLRCLESLRELTYPNYLTIIVDNGSWDDSVKRIKAWARDHLVEGQVLAEYVRSVASAGGEEGQERLLENQRSQGRLVLIRTDENLGYCGGNNSGIEYALKKKYPADYVFLLNNDARVEKGSVSHLVAASEETDAGVVGALIKDDTTGEVQCAGYNGSFPLLRQFFHPFLRWPVPTPGSDKDSWECFWVTGTAMLIRRDTLQQVYASTGRYLDTRLFLYGDELEFCCAARKAGYKSVTTRRALVYHGEAKSSGGRYNSIAYYYSSRNRMLLANTLLPMAWGALFHPKNVMMCLGRVLLNLRHGRYHSARAILSGLVDGYRGVTGKWKHHDREVLRNLSQRKP